MIESNDITEINQQTQENSLVISQLEIDVSNQSDSIDVLNTDITAISTDVTNIATQTTSIEQSLNDLSDLISSNTSNIDTINTDILEINSKIDTLEVNLDETSTQTNDNTTRILSLETKASPLVIDSPVDTVISSIEDVIGGIVIESPGIANQSLTLPDENIDHLLKIINNSDFPCDITLLSKSSSVTLNSLKFMYIQYSTLIPSFVVLSGNI